MALSNQTNFVGVLDGTNVNELNKKIDYRKTKLQDRKKIVEEILDNTEFYSEYFSGYFKGSINSGDHLSQDVNVCKSLERMANYLLNSDEIKAEEDKEITQYIFHTDERYFQKKVERERSMEAMTETTSGGQTDHVLHFLKREGKNYKKPKHQFITDDDLKLPGLVGQVLSDYSSYNDFITAELKKPNSKFNRYLLTKVKGQLSFDMLYTKDHLLGIWAYDLQNAHESTVPDIDVFDFTNRNHLNGFVIEMKDNKGNTYNHHVKGLLYFKPEFNPNDDFSLVLLDLQRTIEKANLTDFEKYVLKRMQDGIKKNEVAHELNVSHVKIGRTMEIIAAKVSRVGNKYDLDEEAN